MKELIPKDELGVFADNHDKARVDSLFVAEFFEKEHKNVLRDIEKLIDPHSGLSSEFGQLNFEPSYYRNMQNKKQPCYLMTRDGFTMLVMGYTGAKAMKFKELYIKRFNANALRDFCNQSESFSKVFYKTKRSFSDCVKETMKGCGQSISDIEVYRRATKFYFPNSEVSFVMNITTEEEPDEKYINKEPPKKRSEAAKKTAPQKTAEPKKAEQKKLEQIQITLF